MLWLKALHIIFVVAWFAGLFYLPRLFVYHVDATDPVSHERFIIMESRLLKITGLAALLALIFGLSLLQYWGLKHGWLHAKLVLVVLLIGYHHACSRITRAFREGRNRRTARWFRIFNEVPAVLLVLIVLLVVVKPF